VGPQKKKKKKKKNARRSQYLTGVFGGIKTKNARSTSGDEASIKGHGVSVGKLDRLCVGIELSDLSLQQKLNIPLLVKLTRTQQDLVNLSIHGLGKLRAIIGQKLLLGDNDDATLKVQLTQSLSADGTSGTTTNDNKDALVVSGRRVAHTACASAGFDLITIGTNDNIVSLEAGLETGKRIHSREVLNISCLDAEACTVPGATNTSVQVSLKILIRVRYKNLDGQRGKNENIVQRGEQRSEFESE
jgi:hypothetical protein